MNTTYTTKTFADLALGTIVATPEGPKSIIKISVSKAGTVTITLEDGTRQYAKGWCPVSVEANR